MSSTWVVRLAQSDKTRPPILINVARKEGGQDLDLDLLATDGEAAFTGKGKSRVLYLFRHHSDLFPVRERSLKKLRARNYDGSDDDWNYTISSILAPQNKPGSSDLQTATLDVATSISGKESKRTLTIVLSNNVEEITQKLGTIDLHETEDTDDVDLFGWTAQAVGQRDNLQGEVTNLKEQVKTKDAVVASLQKQIGELVEAKADHEKQMLFKFALLLNEKKLKIRNMQRILSTAKADTKKLKDLKAVIGKEPGSPVRGKKRPSAGEDQEDDEETDDFETMPEDPASKDEQGPDSSVPSTASQSDADATDDDDVNVPLETSYRPPTRAIQSQVQKDEQPQKPVLRRPEPGQTAIDDDEETASEDSEL